MNNNIRFTSFLEDYITMELIIELTPANYLESNESRFKRAQLLNNQLNTDQNKLLLMHDKYNSHDNLALEVYCSEVFIGYIRKDRSYDPSIDEFCFKHDRLDKVYIEYKNNNIVIKKDLDIFQANSYLFDFIQDNDIEVLKKMGYNINFSDQYNQNALYSAIVDHKDREIISKLINAGAYPNTICRDGTPVLYFALNTETMDIAKLLLDSGANVNFLDKEGNTCLHNAVEYVSDYSPECHDMIDEIKFLINSGIDLNIKNNYGDAAIHIAAKSGETSEIFKLLIDSGADLNIGDKDGYFPLTIVATDYKTERIEQLIHAGANVNTKNKYGETPLILAGHNLYRSFTATELLVNAGADIDVFDDEGIWSPLAIAVADGLIENIKLLVKSGANINILDKDRENVLFHAIKNDKLEIIELLIKLGIDTNIKNTEGKNALDFALDDSRDKIIQLYKLSTH